jgi:hypothetical protein
MFNSTASYYCYLVNPKDGRVTLHGIVSGDSAAYMVNNSTTPELLRFELVG